MSSEREIHDQKSQRYGLVTEAGTPVPLKEISVDFKILGFVAEVTSTLLYTNSEDSPIEAEFTFPVDDSSAVFKFEAEIEGRQIVAEIQEKEQARLTYQDAVEKGSTAMLLKEDDTAGDIFQCTLGNLPPKADAKISFSYVIELPQEPDGKIRFTLPTVLNPRYSPDIGGVVAAEGATYTAPANIPYKFNMTGSVQGYHKVLSVTSEHDKLKVDLLGDKTTSVALAEEFKFDHDLSFLVEYEHCFTPQVLLEMGDSNAEGIMKEDILMVNFYPELKESTTSATGEYVFVIDRSGSMNGERIQNAKQALFLFLKSLPAGCYFNIVSFGSSYDSLFRGGSKEYDKKNLKEALTLQNSMDANMGGTEIFEPLKSVFHNKLIKGHPRQLILLTDGEVGNTDKVIGLVKANANNTRVFALGIGSGVSTSLIKGVARAGNGKAEFIADGDRIQSKVISLLKCATQQAVSDIDLKWELPEDVNAVPIPSEPPSFIGLGERLCLYTLLTGGRLKSSGKTCSVTLSGQCEGKAVNFKMEFTVPSQSQVNVSAPLHRLAAKTQIKLVETDYSELLNDEISMYRYCEDRVTEISNKLILLSKSANIISKMTAFVAVDKEAKKQVEGEMVKRQCPIPVATREFSEALSSYNLMDCGLLDSSSLSSLKCSSLGAPARRKKKSFGGLGLFSKMGAVFQRKPKQSQANPCMAAPPPPPPGPTMCNEGYGVSRMPPPPPPSQGATCNIMMCADLDAELDLRQPDDKSSKWFEMVSLQEIDGFWLLSKEVTSLLELNEQSLTSLEITKDTSVATTLAVIVWLRSKFQDSHDEWEMIEKKALSWLSSKVQTEKNLDEIFEEVKTHLWPQGLN